MNKTADTKPSPSRRLLSAREVAEQLGIGYQAVLDLIHAGELPVVRVPGRVEREDRRRIGPLELKARRSHRIDQVDVDRLITSWKMQDAPEKVGIKVGINDSSGTTQTHEKRYARKNANSSETKVKPNWYKEFTTTH